jgi:hypothetical protein
MDNIPQSFYVIVGGLILANIGTVVTIIYGIGKLVWWLSALNSRVLSVEEKIRPDGQITKDINAAHAAVRELKKEVLNKKGLA